VVHDVCVHRPLVKYQIKMGNDVGGIEGYVYPHDRHTWIAKYGQKVVLSLLDCENSNLLALSKKASATNAALYCHKTLYNTIFDPGFPLPAELKVIEQKLVEKLGGEKKVTKAAAVAPEQQPEFVAGEAKETKIARVKGVSSVKDKTREGIQSSFTDLNVYVVTWNMNGKVRKPREYLEYLCEDEFTLETGQL
jgi:hypothetical protein